MSIKGDRALLVKSLAKAVGWEEAMMQGVADAICSASSKEEIQELTRDYLGGGQEVDAIVSRYLSGDASSSAHQQGQHQQSSSKRGALKAPSRGFVEMQGGSTRPAGPRERQGGSMTIIHKPDKRRAVAAGDAKLSTAPAATRVDRKVVNCLCCGKVYQLQDGSSDVKALIAAAGACTFCGARVALSSSQHSEVRPPAAERAAAAAAQAGSSAKAAPESGMAEGPAGEKDASVAEAVAFKNRLVDYDRNAATRTTVIDDQSDFFEIDSNAWLSDEERQQLKERERLIVEAEQSRRKAVRVTFDLLGRQVILADEARPDSSRETETERLAAVAAAATATERPQGGGTAARAAASAAAGGDAFSGGGEVGGGVPMVLRIRPSPNLKGPPPVFMLRGQGTENLKGSRQESGSRQAQQREARSRPQRLQHDDRFMAFEELSVA